MKNEQPTGRQRYDEARVRRRKAPGGEPPLSGMKAADALIALSARAEELFHAPDSAAYATIPVDNHAETWPVRSRGFRRWLAREFFGALKSVPNSDAMQAALNVIEARAHFDGRERAVYIRVGSHADRLYLDLGDVRWRAVEIGPGGWHIIDHPPIPFRRPAGMLALPEPVHEGHIEELRPFLNIEDSDSFVLTVSFSLAALRGRGPYPVLCLSGEHGAAKSTFTAVLRRLLDPNSAPLRALPREDRDLFIAANNAHVLAFDNVSRLPDWISDTLARLSTGGGFATRQLYSDQDEALFDAMRPVILNGIEDIVARPDLADRSLFLALKNIAEDKRRAELTLWREFDAAHPRILGALLDGVAHGLQQLPSIRLYKVPRMADFALWGAACETAYWEAGTFTKAYDDNRDDAIATVIEADMVASAVQTFMATHPDGWQGTATDLLNALKMAIGEEATKRKDWPGSPRGLSGRLRRAAATLRRVGIDVTFEKDPNERKRTRIIKLSQKGEGPDRPNRPNRPKQLDFNDLDTDGRGDPTVRKPSGAQTTDGTVGSADGSPRRPSANNPLKNKAADGVDGADAKFHTQTDEPGLSRRRIQELADWYGDQSHRRYNEGTHNTAALDTELRAILQEEVAFPEHVEIEFERVMQVVFAVR